MKEFNYSEDELDEIYNEAWEVGYNDEVAENPYMEGTLPWKIWEEGYEYGRERFEDSWNNG